MHPHHRYAAGSVTLLGSVLVGVQGSVRGARLLLTTEAELAAQLDLAGSPGIA